MRVNLSCFNFLLFFILLIASISSAQINSVTILSGTFPLSSPTYSKIEFGVDLHSSIDSMVSSGVFNPYDPDDIDLWAELVDANSMQVEKRINGFYMLEYDTDHNGQATSLSPQQLHNWRIRLVVEEAKQYILFVYLSLNNGPTMNFPQLQISISGQGSSSHGYLRFPKKHTFLQFTDGTPFFGISENLTPFNGDAALHYDMTNQPANIGKDDYPTNAVRALVEIGEEFANYGGNFLKYSFYPNSIDLEWGILGNYDDYQSRAQDFDHVMASWGARDIYVQLALYVWENFNPGTYPGLYDWANHPYRHIPTVDPTRPATLFYDESICNFRSGVMKYFQRKLRYTIARWGWDPHLASIEFMVEIDRVGNDQLNLDDYWGWSGPCNTNKFLMVDDFVKYIGLWMKENLSKRLMFTTGVAGFESGASLLKSDACDYIDYHNYNSDFFNSGCQESYIADWMRYTYHKKPFHCGESGSGNNEQWYGSMSTPSRPEDAQIHFSNKLWQSAFTGAFSTSKHYGVYGSIHSNLWPAAAHEKFRPISEFFNGEDLNSEKYVPIKSMCNDGGLQLSCSNNFATPECLLNPPSLIPHPSIYNTYNQQIDVTNGLASGSSPGIYVSHPLMEAYALRSEKKVLGWVHNKTNYFYNLPHFTYSGGPYVKEYLHPDGNGVLPTSGNNADQIWQTEAYVTDLDNNDNNLTITGLNCEGVYKIEWYSTRGNGGVIPSLTQLNLSPVNGNLTVQVPNLSALSFMHSDLPDYGFKIIMTKNDGYSKASTWKMDYVNHATQSSDNNTQIVVTGNNKIYYRGNDNLLHCYYYDEYCWENETVPIWSSDFQPSSGTGIAVNTPSNQVFYRNNRGRLQQVYENATNGNVPNWGIFEHTLAPLVSINSNDIFTQGTSVYYVSTNNYITEVYWDGSSWQHFEISWPPAVSLNSNAMNCFAIMPNERKIFYRNVYGKIEQLYWGLYQGVYQWVSYTHSSAPSVAFGSDIKITPDGRVVYESIDGYVVILSFNSNTQQWVSQEISWLDKMDANQRLIAINGLSQIFYKNLNGNLQQIYWDLYQGSYQWIGYTHWVSSISPSSGIVINSQRDIFYYDTNGDLNQFYFDISSNSWLLYVHNVNGYVHPNKLYFDQFGKLFYSNNFDRKLQVLWYDNPCIINPPCTYSNYKKSSTDPHHYLAGREVFDLAKIQVKDGSNIEENIDNSDKLNNCAFTVYPNPSHSGIFYVSVANWGTVRVSDIHGRYLLQKELTGADNKIDLTNYSNGVYFISFATEGEILYKKIAIYN